MITRLKMRLKINVRSRKNRNYLISKIKKLLILI